VRKSHTIEIASHRRSCCVMREPRPRPALKYGDDRLSVSGELCRSARSKRERGRLVRPVFGIGFQGRSIVRVPLKQVHLCPVLFGEGQSAISDRARIADGASQIPTPAHTAGTGLKPAAYGLNAHLELQVLNGGARNRRRPCGGGDQPAFRSPPAKPAPATIWMRTQRQSRWPFRRSRRRDDCRGPTITQAIFA
jgi:hypothetical protein